MQVYSCLSFLLKKKTNNKSTSGLMVVKFNNGTKRNRISRSRELRCFTPFAIKTAFYVIKPLEFKGRRPGRERNINIGAINNTAISENRKHRHHQYFRQDV